jgi:hypothetical protein
MDFARLVSWLRSQSSRPWRIPQPRRRRIVAEALEVRLALAVAPPIAVDDAFAIDSRIYEVDSDNFDTSASQFDVLANELTIANAAQFSSIEIIEGPLHGEARVQERGRIGYFGSLVDTVDDEDSPVGDGHASALTGVVDQYGQIRLRVGESGDIYFTGTRIYPPYNSTYPAHVGDYSLFVRQGTDSFAGFDPARFDFRYNSTLAVGKADLFVTSGQLPGTKFIAWIDNTVGAGRPDTLMLDAGPMLVEYQPEVGFVGTDHIRYSLTDLAGHVSEATVTITVNNRPPIAIGEEYDTAPGTPVTYYASDPDGILDPADVTFVVPPEHGTFDIAPDEWDPNLLVINYLPEPDFLGTDRFSFFVVDQYGAASEIATATIHVVEIVQVNAPPEAGDDVSGVLRNTPRSIDVLANDFDPDGSLDPVSLTISLPPAHGTAEVQQTGGATVVVYTPDLDYLGPDTFSYTVGDDAGAISIPATVTLNPPPQAQDDEAATMERVSVLIDVLANDEPSASGIYLDLGSLKIISPPRRGRVDLLRMDDGWMALYSPGARAAHELIVDELSDRDDGNYSTGHLTLREAVKLANADRFTDTFTYTVLDEYGVASSPATVTVHVSPSPTTIRFASKFTTWWPATLTLSQVGDTAGGNSALLITGNIQLVGPAGGPALTLAGQGQSSDLRLFQVATGGELALSHLTLTRAATDGSGAVLQVAAGASASLDNCVLTSNFAVQQGGAIFNLGTLSVTNSTFTANQAGQGGAISSLGTVSIVNSQFSVNRADQGGAILNGQGQTTLQNVSITYNIATLAGGGLWNTGTLDLSGSRVTGNRAASGGGISNIGHGDLTLTDCILSGNVADAGGGIDNAAGISVSTPLGEYAGSVTLTRTTIQNNIATQGGGIRNFGLLTVNGSILSGNHAQQGGGLYNSVVVLQVADTGVAGFTDSKLSANTALLGSGVYIDHGSVELTNTPLVWNDIRRNTPTVSGTTVSNLDWSAGYAVMPPDTTEYWLTNWQDLLRKTSGGWWEVLAKDVVKYQQARNGDLYLLNKSNELKRLQLGTTWATLQGGVQDFHIDEFGTVFVRDKLNFITMYSALDRYYVLPAIPAGVPIYSDDQHPVSFEAVHAMGMDSAWGGGQGRWELPSAYLRNDIQWFGEPWDVAPPFPLTNELQVLLDAHGLPVPESFPAPANPPLRNFDTSYYNNVRMVIERVVDKVDDPLLIPAVGLAQLHHVVFKVTLYSQTIPRNANPLTPGGFDFQIDRIYISHDHLHVLTPETPATPIWLAPALANPLNGVGGVPVPAPTPMPIGRATPTPVAAAQGLGNASRLITAADGTLYKPGRGETGQIWYGNEDAPYHLWQLPPNGLWKPLGFFLAHAVGPDSRLYALDPEHVLRTPALGPTKWATIAENVQSFIVSPDGTLYVLGMNGDLKIRPAGSSQWTSTESGVTALMISPQGRIYTTNSRHELRLGIGSGSVYWLPVSWGVRTVEMVEDGSLYLLNDLKQVVRFSPLGVPQILATNVRQFQIAPDGGVHALTVDGNLQRLTARDHWTVLDTKVRTFQFAANGDLYLINQQQELRRQKAGYSWMTLQSGVESFTMYSNGTISALDSIGEETLYSSLGRTVILPPYGEEGSEMGGSYVQFAILHAANLQYLNEPFSPENDNDQIEQWGIYGDGDLATPILPIVNRVSSPLRYSASETPNPPRTRIDLLHLIETENVGDQLDPPRYVPGLGLLQLHHLQYKSTITWTTPDGTKRTWVIYIDLDHEHGVP